MRGARRIGLASIAVALLIGLAAPGLVGAARRTGAPVHLSLTFVDHSRPTVDPTGTRSAPTRTLITDVYVPRGKGPFPLIAFAHGFNGNPGKLTQLLGGVGQGRLRGRRPGVPADERPHSCSGRPRRLREPAG